MNYEIRYVRGHVEVCDQTGRFRLSTDPGWEVLEELEQDFAAQRQNGRRTRLCRVRLLI